MTVQYFLLDRPFRHSRELPVHPVAPSRLLPATLCTSRTRLNAVPGSHEETAPDEKPAGYVYSVVFCLESFIYFYLLTYALASSLHNFSPTCPVLGTILSSFCQPSYVCAKSASRSCHQVFLGLLSMLCMSPIICICRPSVCTVSYGQISFACSAHSSWNPLPQQVRSSDSVSTFRCVALVCFVDVL